MSIARWFRDIGFGGSSKDEAPAKRTSLFNEDSEPDYSKMTPEQIEVRERALHRVRKLDRLASDMDRVTGRRKHTTPVGLDDPPSEVVWPDDGQGYNPRDFKNCAPKAPFTAQKIEVDFVVRTQSGPVRGRAGDYILRMPNGIMNVLRPEEFESMFEFTDE